MSRHLGLKPPRSLPMRGVTTQVSAQRSITACITALKKNPYTHGSAPSLLRMCDVLLQFFLARYKSFTTAGQLTSAAYITPSPGI